MPIPSHRQRQQIIEIFTAGVAAADPYAAVKSSLSYELDQLHISLDTQDRTKIRTDKWTNIHVIAFGKAACAMAKAAQEIIPTSLLSNQGIAVTTYENVNSIDHFQVIGAGHPLPDQSGLHAAAVISERLLAAKQGELVLVLVSGGGSALLPAPVAGITLEDKIVTTNMLLSSGANINQINCVRKHLSQLKGGGMAKLAVPADLHALILSDVLGDDLSSIASGPTVADPTSFDDAVSIIESFKIWEQIPASARSYLQQGALNLHPETPKSDSAIFKRSAYSLIGSNLISIDAAVNASRKYHYQSIIYSRHLSGEARVAAENLAAQAKNLQAQGLTTPTAIIAGGETTVTLSGSGKGGRNQEMTLAFALAAEQIHLSGNWLFLSGGTDGRDGPTDAAGGIADANTLQRIRQSGLDPLAMLHNHDSYHALQAAGDLLMTGSTGTNVADLQILLLHPENG